MTTHAALVRGINVAGRKLAMSDLRDAFAAVGASDVQTYIQSGNVVFSLGKRIGPAFVQSVERAIADASTLDVRVLIRSHAELAAIVTGNPFLRAKADPAKLHVTFLDAAPAKARAAALKLPNGSGRDEFAIRGREIYVHCPDGYGRTKINNTFFERGLSINATTRNWNTVTKLAEMTGG